MNPVNAVIREAQPRDATRLADLRYEFRSALGDVVEPREAFTERAARWILERLQSGRWHIWAAEDADATIIGHCFLQAVEKVPNPVEEAEWIGYVTNVYVQPHARRNGIAGRLLQAALDYCRAHGAYSIILWPTDESRSLYERRGFIAPTRLMEMSCSTNTPSFLPNSTAPRAG
jgi:GNAT superfamily N-acetyltransferase